MSATWTAFRMLAFMTLVTGLAYPLAVTAVARLAFPAQAEGSLARSEAGIVVGSRLVGQKFSAAEHFWPRPSAIDYQPLPSGGSNAGWSQAAFVKTLGARAAAGAEGEMLYASASGLDPHIRPETARRQVARVAAATGVPASALEALIQERTEGRQFRLLGEPRVNVLELNLALEEWREGRKTQAKELLRERRAP